jgi:hypothetical protein
MSEGKRMVKRRSGRIRAPRKVVVRDFAIFQLKLLLDGFKDVALSALSLGALVIDLLAGGGRRPRVFYSVLAISERFDLWLNLSGAVSRLQEEELDEDGLFGASDAGSDTLLGKVEEIVRGGDIPRHLRQKLDDERRRRGGSSPTGGDGDRHEDSGS